MNHTPELWQLVLRQWKANPKEQAVHLIALASVLGVLTLLIVILAV